MKTLIGGQKGLTIVEVLLGLAMITLVGSFFVSGVVSMKKQAKESGTKNSLYKQINDVIEGIRPNVRMYQINFNSTDQERDDALNVARLPMAWGNGIISSKEKCPSCPGRFGYVVQAYPAMSGLYLVTVRMTHKDWAPSDKDASTGQAARAYGYMDYQFVVNAQ